MLLPTPTVRGKVTALLALGAVALAFVKVNIATGMLATGLCALLLTSFMMACFSLYRLELRRSGMVEGVRGGRVRIPLRLLNHGSWHRQAVIIEEHLPFVEEELNYTPVEGLAGGESIWVERSPLACKRGFYELSRVRLIGGDPAGIFRRVRTFHLPMELTVYPASVPVSWIPIRIRRQVRATADGRPLGVSGIGQELFGVREYRPTDGVRFIHWKASARQHNLMVREFEAYGVSQVNLLLDVNADNAGEDSDDSNFEYLIEMAGSITEYLSGMYCRLLFISGAGGANPSVIFEEGSAGSIRGDVRNALARLVPVRLPVSRLLDSALDQVQPNSILYCLTMDTEPEIFDGFDILLERGVDIRWIQARREGFPVLGRRSHCARGELEENPESTDAGLNPYAVRRGMDIGRVLGYG